MIINKRNFYLVLSLALFCFCIYGQQSQKSLAENKSASAFMPLSDVKEGMRGTARTVFRGNQPEDFSVEILGVVPGGIGPKQDLIIGKISGGSADRTSVFAGMSGSPVYVDGKLIGAISYSFPFSKEPICGITPIHQMIDIFEKNQNVRRAQNPRPISYAQIASDRWEPEFIKRSAVSSQILSGVNPNSPLGAVAGQAFQPIATPVTFSGFSQETLNQFAPQLMSVGLLPVSAAGGAARITPMKKADENTLVGGTSVSMQLTRGDFSMAASGTVTFRDKDKIYAFGHPFLNLGVADLPMSESHVVTVIPSISNSFKLAVPDAMVGNMSQDRATGVFGQLGKSPRMVPVHLTLQTSRDQEKLFVYEVVKDEFLSPLLLNMTVNNALTANERGLGDSTVEVRGEIKIAGNEPVKFNRRFAGMQAVSLAGLAASIPMNALLKSRFDNLEISEVKLDIVSTESSNLADIERIILSKTQVRAGETFEVQAYLRSNSGKTFVQNIPVTIPADTPAGVLMVKVGDGSAIQQNSSTKEFVPKDLAELIKTINQVKRSDRLYVQTYRVTGGAIIGAKELPNLPPSVLATLNNERTAGGFKPTVQTILTEQEVPFNEFIVSGQETLAVEIIK